MWICISETERANPYAERIFDNIRRGRLARYYKEKL